MPKLQTLVRLLLGWALVSSTCSAAPGDLDTTFGSGTGIVTTTILSQKNVAQALVLQPDGRIIVAGSCAFGIEQFCVARYLPEGTLDTTFNSTGTATTLIGYGWATATAVLVQPDGKIVVTGHCRKNGYQYFCLARYHSSGMLDTTFGDAGMVTTLIGLGDSQATAAALQPDGKIIVTGLCSDRGIRKFCLARYLPTGSLDTEFNATGIVLTSVGSNGDNSTSLALQSDGKIYVAGYCQYGVIGTDFCLARYLPNGTLDTSFNTTGTFITAVGSGFFETANAVALQPDGNIVVAGYCANGNTDFCLARITQDGTLDSSFNFTGTVTTPVGSSGVAFASAIALQADGRIVVVGPCSNANQHDFCLVRYLSSGALDSSFNATGKVTTDIGSRNDYANAIVVQPDGKILIAGGCFKISADAFCLVRYEGGPLSYRNCSLDIDGDNLVLATTDMLIGTRIALGMTGPAVLSGISFAPHATRPTWPLIRDYLVSQCGMSIVP